MSKRKYPPISIHRTLHGQLEVDWQKDYNDEFSCPHCPSGKIISFWTRKGGTTCQLILACDSCKKTTNLTQKLRRLPVSHHQTSNGILKVDWPSEYQQEYNCPGCNKGKLTKYCYDSKSVCNLSLVCNSCQKITSLTCRVSGYIFKYLPEIECPNPLCKDIGHDGQKGWIYKEGKICKCHFCQIAFNPHSVHHSSWMVSQVEKKILPFSFEEDTWDLRHFYDKLQEIKTFNFQKVNPYWYRQEVKKYIYYQLKLKVPPGSLKHIIIPLKQLGKAMITLNIKNLTEINRDVIIQFLDSCQNNQNDTINKKLANLRNFLDWLDLETSFLIRSRDFLKTSKNDADWLDKVTRQAIEQHLDKIPAPIARQYLVQAYIAVRPIDGCELPFDCLREENGKWYVKFLQQKVKRWHRIPATRKIRKVIEEQQQWIREVFGENYSYLFCHFRNIKRDYYPKFSKIRPLPQPPIPDTQRNAMVRIIRMLIEKENVLDANGQKPYFTGRITRSSRLQEIRSKYGIEAAQLYADHKSSATTFQYYAPPTREQVAQVDLPFQKLLINPDNKFLPWQSLPESLLKDPKAHELDLEIAPRLVVYGHCTLDPKTPCPINLFPKCYGCSSFRPSTGKLPLYERQYQGEQQRLTQAEKVGAELAQEESERKYQPHSLKTLHQVAKDKIRKLEEEIRELKRQNGILRGHLAEIYEIRDENKRLRTQLRELTNPNSSNKVVPIQASVKEKKATSSPKSTSNDTPESVIESLKAMGINVNHSLREEIGNRDLKKVKSSIEAYKQYRDSHNIKSQEACLLSMICDEAKPNTERKLIMSKSQQKITTAPSQPQKELVSLDKLKELNSLFNPNND